MCYIIIICTKTIVAQNRIVSIYCKGENKKMQLWMYEKNRTIIHEYLQECMHVPIDEFFSYNDSEQNDILLKARKHKAAKMAEEQEKYFEEHPEQRAIYEAERGV